MLLKNYPNAMKRKLIYSSIAILMLVIIAGIVIINPLLPIITGYAAKNLASDVFVSHRNVGDVESLDLNFSFIRFTSNEVDTIKQEVVSRFLWGKSTAIYRQGFGCTLIRDVDKKSLKEVKYPISSTSPDFADIVGWPMGNRLPDSIKNLSLKPLEQIADNLIEKQHYGGYAFSFLVLHKGVPILEKYNKGIGPNTRLLSWSMAKSFTSALTGIMVMDGKLDIHQPAAISQWQEDERKNITINDLLQMQSGLEWNEEYGNRSDVTVMLHETADFAAYAFNKPPAFSPGTHWYYSSGSTNIINYLMRKVFHNDNDYYSFAAERLFNKIGMSGAVFETDASGTQVGSSYIYATTRDYARFALLYLQDGMYNGERILPEGWVEYTTTAASDSKGRYGAGFWLNLDHSMQAAPTSMYRCQGHNGQRIFIFPEQQMAIVVLGYSPKKSNDMDFNRLIADVLSVIPNK